MVKNLTEQSSMYYPQARVSLSTALRAGLLRRVIVIAVCLVFCVWTSAFSLHERSSASTTGLGVTVYFFFLHRYITMTFYISMSRYTENIVKPIFWYGNFRVQIFSVFRKFSGKSIFSVYRFKKKTVQQYYRHP